MHRKFNAAALQRLRTEREATAWRDEQRGAEAGRRWACKAASYEQLEALADLHKLTDLAIEADPLADLLDALDCDQAEAALFAVAWFQQPQPSSDAIAGFARGAAEVFAAV